MIGLAEGFDLGGHYVLGLLGLGLALVVAVGALSHQHERAFSAAVFYVVLGGVGALALSVLDIAPLDPLGDHVLLERLTELALIVAVFSAGLTVEAHVPRRSVVSIVILLAVVMPLTIAVIAAFGKLVMGLSLGAAVLLGAILAPTDPVLAGDVGLGPPGSQPQGEPRLSLHTEAGLNDGSPHPSSCSGCSSPPRAARAGSASGCGRTPSTRSASRPSSGGPWARARRGRSRARGRAS